MSYLPVYVPKLARWRLVHRMLRNHVGLNYSFSLNSEVNIDSARVGNETRYINHANDDRANAHAVGALSRRNVCGLSSFMAYLVKLVCGDRRIGMYACRSNLFRNSDVTTFVD